MVPFLSTVINKLVFLLQPRNKRFDDVTEGWDKGLQGYVVLDVTRSSKNVIKS